MVIFTKVYFVLKILFYTFYINSLNNLFTKTTYTSLLVYNSCFTYSLELLIVIRSSSEHQNSSTEHLSSSSEHQSSSSEHTSNSNEHQSSSSEHQNSSNDF